MKMLIVFVLGLVALPAILLLSAIEGMLPSDSLAQPSNLESSLGMKAIDASLEKRSRGLVDPSNTAGNLPSAQNRTTFANKCSFCHGSPSHPSALGTGGLYPRAPQFFEEGTDVTRAQAYSAIRDGIRYSAMPGWHGELDDQQIWNLANFILAINPKRSMAKMN